MTIPASNWTYFLFFKVNVSDVPDVLPYDCGPAVMTSPEGSVFSPGVRQETSYPSNSSCRWEIRVPEGRLVRMVTSSNGNIFRVTGHCVGNSPVTGEFPTQRPVTQSFDVFLDLHLNKRLSKQPWGWWFETPPRSLWRHCNGLNDSLVSLTHYIP